MNRSSRSWSVRRRERYGRGVHRYGRTTRLLSGWWVVSPGGRLAGVVTLPADASIQWLDAEVIVLRRNDEFGVERLQFYELGERRRKYLEGAPS